MLSAQLSGCPSPSVLELASDPCVPTAPRPCGCRWHVQSFCPTSVGVQRGFASPHPQGSCSLRCRLTMRTSFDGHFPAAPSSDFSSRLVRFSVCSSLWDTLQTPPQRRTRPGSSPASLGTIGCSDSFAGLHPAWPAQRLTEVGDLLPPLRNVRGAEGKTEPSVLCRALSDPCPTARVTPVLCGPRHVSLEVGVDGLGRVPLRGRVDCVPFVFLVPRVVLGTGKLLKGLYVSARMSLFSDVVKRSSTFPSPMAA